MGNIIHFKTKTDNIIEFLNNVIEDVKKNNIDKIIVACKDKENQLVLTGYANLNRAEKQELLGHIQVDIIRDMIESNYITPD